MWQKSYPSSGSQVFSLSVPAEEGKPCGAAALPPLGSLHGCSCVGITPLLEPGRGSQRDLPDTTEPIRTTPPARRVGNLQKASGVQGEGI